MNSYTLIGVFWENGILLMNSRYRINLHMMKVNMQIEKVSVY
jgi:hypothetical protein